MRLQGETMAKINNNELLDCSRFSVEAGLRGAYIVNNSNKMVVCDVVDISAFLEDLQNMKEAIEETTGIIL